MPVKQETKVAQRFPLVWRLLPPLTSSPLAAAALTRDSRWNELPPHAVDCRVRFVQLDATSQVRRIQNIAGDGTVTFTEHARSLLRQVSHELATPPHPDDSLSRHAKLLTFLR
jgi:hypothetical protein